MTEEEKKLLNKLAIELEQVKARLDKIEKTNIKPQMLYDNSSSVVLIETEIL